MKICTNCKVERPTSEFNKDRDRPDGLYPWCKECTRKKGREWYANHPDKGARHHRNRLLSYYGLEPDDYAQLLAAQDGACAICREPERDAGRRLAVDHDHETGRIRGLLCRRCNTAIGLLQESPSVLSAALQYLLAEDHSRFKRGL